MFGIETTTGTKLQIGFILLILGVAGFLLLHNSKKPVNDAVNSWVEKRQYILAGSNPKVWDNKREELWNVFTCWDGKLKIIEYTGDPTKRPFMVWEVDKNHGPGYLYYHDPMAHAAKIKDPFKHAITLAAYGAAVGRSLGLMTNANLTPDQRTQEAAARKLMSDELETIHNRQVEGNFHSDMYNKVLSVLADYKKITGDPTKAGTEKAIAAHKVIETTSDYLNKVEDEQSTSIEKYITAISGILTAAQKTIVAEEGKQYELKNAPKPPTATPPVAAARGGANTRPAQTRGAVTPRQPPGRAATTPG